MPLTLRFTPNGYASVDANGYVGGRCRAASAPYLKSLGQAQTDTLKSEACIEPAPMLENAPTEQTIEQKS